MGQEHPQVTYLKQEHISLVLSKALSETYKHQPNDPVTFFSRYLLNHCNVEKLQAKVSAPLPDFIYVFRYRAKLIARVFTR